MCQFALTGKIKREKDRDRERERERENEKNREYAEKPHLQRTARWIIK